MNWIYYLLEANLYLTVFYALYYLILKNETYYQLNRVYLLFTSALAFLIPFLQLGFLKPVYQTVAPVIVPTQHPVIITLLPPVKQVNWGLADYLLTVYISISCMLAIHLAIKVYSLIRLSYQNKTIINNSYKLIEIGSGANAFSFFHYLFISNDQPQKQTVINHELIHIQQKHSWDILYLQVLKIINWFNPIVYLLLYSLKEQHEFIADRETSAREENTSAYATFLLNNVYGIGQSGLTNTFFNKSLLKKRIIMLHQKPSGTLARLKYLAALPVCAALLCASTLAFSKSYGWIVLAPQPKSDTTYSNQTEHNSVYINTKAFTTAKGYKVEEKTIIHNGDWTRKATITDKAGNNHVYYYEKTTPAERKMLLETYGYEFPKPKVFNIRLMPPPVAPKIAPLPPVKPKISRMKNAAPASVVPAVPMVSAAHPAPPVDKVIVASPQSSAQSLNDSSKMTIITNKVSFQPSKKPAETPLIFVNGEKYYLKETRKVGQQIICSATDSLVSYAPGTLLALKKWGDEAKNGVILLYGKDISVEVK